MGRNRPATSVAVEAQIVHSDYKQGELIMISDSVIRRGMLVLRFIWYAMLISQVIYLFVGLYVRNNLQTSINEDSYTLFKYLLCAITCIVLAATWYLRNFLLSRKDKSIQVHDFQGVEHPALQKYLVASIVSWALSESIGIFGLILFLIGRNIADLYIFVLIAAVAMFLYKPRKEDISRMAEDTGETPVVDGSTS